MNCSKLGLSLFLFAIIVTAPPPGVCAPVPDECVRDEPLPVFEGKQSGIRSHKFSLVSNHEANEYLEINSGESVDIHHGGCEYFLTTFRFKSPLIQKNNSSRRNTYNVAAALLRRLQKLKASSGFDLNLAAGTLEAAARNNSVLEFEQQLAVDGDGTNFLQTQVQVDDAGRKLGIGFVQISLFKGPL